MDNHLAVIDAQPSVLDEPADGFKQPSLDDLVRELGVTEPLMTFVAADPPDAQRPPLDPEALDPVIFAGLLAP